MATKAQGDAALFVTADPAYGQPATPEAVFGSRRAAKSFPRLGRKTLMRAVQFEPMQREHRFRVVELEWGPNAIIDRACTTERGAGERGHRIDRALRAFERACKSYPLPTSLVDVPLVKVHGSNEYWATKPLTREAALEQAAKLNAERLGGVEFLGQIVGADLEKRWFVVVELGKRVTVDVACVDLEETLLGVEHRTTYRPVRLVRPTEAELAEFPLPAECL